MKYKNHLLALLATTLAFTTSLAKPTEKPNVIIVMTDDQGYGDLGFTGNTEIKTPTIDNLRKESTLLNNFHVDPTCAPTRSALMTGRYSDRVGVWHTVMGRSMLRSREITMADVFTDNGYATGIFGKWHLGDCYPFRPEDRGFQHTVYHKAGGLNQAPDYWGNDYFDDTYIVNGEYVRFEGYCTDIWFGEGMKFIEENVKSDKPFFAYITPNAPHGPFYCPEEYTKPYEGNTKISTPEFYGMVENIDDNMALLVKQLEDLGIADNTILVFMTDNGTGGGLVRGKNGEIIEGRGFDGNMRGKKGSQYEGGHRVPFIIRWPNGNIEAGKSIENLTAHVDILPTIIELCNLEAPEIEYDGNDLTELLLTHGGNWEERTLIVENQRVIDPIKWRKHAVMTDQWRLTDGKELYSLKDDPKQENDIADQHPDVVKRLRSEYEEFWADVSQEHDITSYMIIGSEKSPIVSLSSHDWLMNEYPAWDQKHVRNGAVLVETHWAIKVEQDGEYEVSLRRWPVEADKGINDGTYGKAFDFESARLMVGDVDVSAPIKKGAKEITFKVTLKKGVTKLAPRFISEDVTATPYYAYVTHKPVPGWQTPKGMDIPVYDPDFGDIPPQLKK